MKELTQQEIHDLATDLSRLAEQLQQTLEQASQSAQVVNLDQQAFGRVSRGDTLQQQSMAKASLEKTKKRLRQVKQAQQRVVSGDYGFCLNCDNPIGFPRLQARPETPLCIQCQSKAEQ